jgi:fumarate reductase subunit D
MARSNEPAVWSLFSAGGMMAAFLLPIHVLLFGILFGTSAISLTAGDVQKYASHPLGKLYLVALISLCLFHAAHRLRFALVDIGLKAIAPVLPFLLYGGAAVGSVMSIVIVVGL